MKTKHIQKQLDFFVRDKAHHAYRKPAGDAHALAAELAAQGLDDMQRSVARLRYVLAQETPVVFPDERITLLRTVRTIPEIHTEEDMVAAAKAIYEDLGCAVLLKGGHNINDANDLLYTKEEVSWFKGKRINNPNTHGTGCTLSSAIAANLAKGFDLKISVQRAKDYISRALADMLDLGAGSGPMNHGFAIRGEY